jgi:hypothetical protein
LIENALGALGARAKLIAPHLGDDELQVRDHRSGSRKLSARFHQRRSEPIVVFGKRIISVAHAEHSTISR